MATGGGAASRSELQRRVQMLVAPGDKASGRSRCWGQFKAGESGGAHRRGNKYRLSITHRRRKRARGRGHLSFGEVPEAFFAGGASPWQRVEANGLLINLRQMTPGVDCSDLPAFGASRDGVRTRGCSRERAPSCWQLGEVSFSSILEGRLGGGGGG